MITEVDPRILLLAAVVLLLTGVILPALMVMQYLPSTFLLNFIAYGASFLGLITGMVGIMLLVLRNRRGG